MGMVVYEKLVIDLGTGKVLEAKGSLHSGPFLAFGGGGKGGGGGSSTTTTVDYGYNSRMADIAEEQQDWARDYYNMWRNNGFRQYEIEQVAENRAALPKESALYQGQLDNASSLLPYQGEAAKTLYEGAKAQGDLYKQQIDAAKSLLPAQQQYAQTQMANAQALQPLQHSLNQKFLKESGQGVDVLERMGLAQADVVNAWKGQNAANDRAMARMGVNPNSGRFAGIKAVQTGERAAQMAGARTTARVGAEQENYERLKNGVQFQSDLSGVGNINSLGSEAAQGTLGGASNLNQDILQGIGAIRG